MIFDHRLKRWEGTSDPKRRNQNSRKRKIASARILRTGFVWDVVHKEASCHSGSGHKKWKRRTVTQNPVGHNKTFGFYFKRYEGGLDMS